MVGFIVPRLGYVVMMVASQRVAQGHNVLPYWLMATYILHTFGEICLYPIGLSAVTKLSPKRLAGRMMGVWFMSLALGNLLAGLYSSGLNATRIDQVPQLVSVVFRNAAFIILGASAVMIAFSRQLKRLSVTNCSILFIFFYELNSPIGVVKCVLLCTQSI